MPIRHQKLEGGPFWIISTYHKWSARMHTIRAIAISEAKISTTILGNYKDIVCRTLQYPRYSRSMCLMLFTGTWFRCLVKMTARVSHSEMTYTWHEMMFFSRWEQKSSRVFCVGAPSDFVENLEQQLLTDAETFEPKDPYVLLVFLIGQVIVLYNQSVWQNRDLIRSVEKVW